MKYINLIEQNDSTIVIRGLIGKRIYVYYTKREAVRKYNKECKEKSYGQN